jgi:hypothetical protein
MAVMKKKTRRKLSKQLNKLIKLHGAEMALALVTGIVSALAAEQSNKAAKKQKGKAQKAQKGAKAAKPPVKTVVVRKRARPA